MSTLKFKIQIEFYQLYHYFFEKAVCSHGVNVVCDDLFHHRALNPIFEKVNI